MGSVTAGCRSLCGEVCRRVVLPRASDIQAWSEVEDTELNSTEAEACKAFLRDTRQGSRLEGQDWGSIPPNRGRLGQREAKRVSVASRS